MPTTSNSRKQAEDDRFENHIQPSDSTAGTEDSWFQVMWSEGNRNQTYKEYVGWMEAVEVLAKIY